MIKQNKEGLDIFLQNLVGCLLYQFPLPAGTHYHKLSSLKQHFWKSQPHQSEIKALVGLPSFWALQVKIYFFPFLAKGCLSAKSLLPSKVTHSQVLGFRTWSLWGRGDHLLLLFFKILLSWGFPGGPVDGSLPTNGGVMGSIPGLERSHKPVLHNRRSHCNERPTFRNTQQPSLSTTRESQ